MHAGHGLQNRVIASYIAILVSYRKLQRMERERDAAVGAQELSEVCSYRTLTDSNLAMHVSCLSPSKSAMIANIWPE